MLEEINEAYKDINIEIKNKQRDSTGTNMTTPIFKSVNKDTLEEEKYTHEIPVSPDQIYTACI